MDKKLPEKLCFNNAYLSLPSEWDASVSQLEMMQKIAYNINQIVQFLTDLETNYQDYTDTKIAELKAELLQALSKAVEDLRVYIDTQDVYYWTEHTKDIKRLDNLISELKLTHLKDVAQLNGKIDEVKVYLENYTDFAIERLRNWTMEQLENLKLEIDEVNENGFRIFDPTTGYRERVGVTVNNVYDVLRVRAITCGYFGKWFTAFDKNCTDFKKLYIRAGEFDAESYYKMYGVFDSDVNSPASGDAITHARALDEVMQVDAELHLTAQEFDSVMQETCAAIKSKNKDALWWDTENATFYDDYNAGNGLGNRTVGRSPHGFRKIGVKAITPPAKPEAPSSFPYRWTFYPSFNYLPLTVDNECEIDFVVETNSNIAGTYSGALTNSYKNGLQYGNTTTLYFNFNTLNVFNEFAISSIRGVVKCENILLKELLVDKAGAASLEE